MAAAVYLLGETLEVLGTGVGAAVPYLTGANVEAAAGAAVDYGVYRTAKRYYDADDGDGVRKKLKFEQDTSAMIANRCVTRTTKSGKKKKMGNALIRRMLLASQQYAISRYQSLPAGGVFDSITAGATMKLGYYHQTAQNRVYMPVYCYNMTALPVNLHNRAGVVADASSIPFYRLYKDIATNTYRWLYQIGINNNATGTSDTAYWQGEDTSNTKPAQIDDYTIEWLNMRLLFKGATTRPNDIEVSEVSFPSKAGPARQYVQAATLYYEDDLPTGDEENEVTTFWDHYLAPRTGHPLRTSYMAPNAIDKQIIRYSTKKINIMPLMESMEVEQNLTTAYDSGQLPLMHCENIFKRMNKLIKVRSDNPNASNTAIVTSTVSNNPAYATNTTTTQCALFQSREKERWMMISAKTYYRTSGLDERTALYRTVPSFDMVIRQKILWNQDT